MLKRRIYMALSETADLSLVLGQYEDARLANYEVARSALAAAGAKMMPFPNQVNVQPAPAVAGDFASTNPRSAYLAGPGGLVCGAAGVTVGRFAWANYVTEDSDSAPATVTNAFNGVVPGVGGNLPSGLVHREQQGLITLYLGESSMVIPAGFPVTLMNGGDFWVKNDGSTQATPGMYAFANFADGRVVFGTGTQSTIGTGSTSSGTVTGSIGPQTATFNASISGNTMTVTNLVSGTIQVGGTVSGGTGVVAGTQIVSQVSGTTGGVGVYQVNIAEQTVSSALLTEAYGLFTVASSAVTLAVGDLLTGTASGMVPTVVTALGTGSGGAGTYIVSATQTIALNSIVTATLNIQTKFIAMTSGLAGELVKITNSVYG